MNLASMAGVLSFSLSAARAAVQVGAVLLTGTTVSLLSRHSRLLGAACAVASLSCRAVPGIESWVACTALLNATSSLIALVPHVSSWRAALLSRPAPERRAHEE